MKNHSSGKSHGNQGPIKHYKIYLPSLKQWVEVIEKQYYGYYRDIWSTRKRAQTHGQCMCKKEMTWLCDGDCLACEFHSAGDVLSLDYAVEDNEGNQKTWLDNLADDSLDAQSIIEDRELLDALYQKLQELDPDGQRICRLIMAGKSEREIAADLGIPRNTYTYRREKLFKVLRELLEFYYS